MKNKYFNDAIIGNKNMVASFSKKGEMLRLFYPTTDNRQFIDFFNTGVKINNSGLICLNEDVNNTYKQYFTEDTNILNTEIFNSYFNLKITQTDFVSIKENVLIKKYTFKNESKTDLDVKFLIHSQLLTSYNNYISGYFKDDILMQYAHDYTYCIFSKQNPYSYQINDNNSNINSGEIGGKDYVGMSADSSISYDVGKISPGKEKTLDILIYINDNKDTKNIDSIIQKVEKYKKIDTKIEYEKTKKYWIDFVEEHQMLDSEKHDTEVCKKIQKIYNRGVLLFPLLTNEETGGISAAVEIDENMSKCGRYSYCWPRDAIFITKALDICRMENVSEKFYKTFCKNTQLKNRNVGAKILHRWSICTSMGLSNR